MAGGRRDRGQHGGCSVQGARIWLDVGGQRPALWRQYVTS